MILKVSKNNVDNVIFILRKNNIRDQNVFLINPIIITAKGYAKNFI
jgi:hypothetical protein